MTADQLAVLCQRLAEGTDAVRTTADVRALAETIVERVRAGVPLDDLTDDFDALEDRLLDAGHAAGLSSVRSYDRLPGAGDGHAVLAVLKCPGRSCTRVEPPDADPVPCLVHRRPMVTTRLRS
ncbi:hypothetical protein ABTZ99_11540 [Actinosynnema sp. NPDC002837]